MFLFILLSCKRAALVNAHGPWGFFTHLTFKVIVTQLGRMGGEGRTGDAITLLMVMAQTFLPYRTLFFLSSASLPPILRTMLPCLSCSSSGAIRQERVAHADPDGCRTVPSYQSSSLYVRV